MVGVAQLVEHFFVEEVVAGSSPVAHPNTKDRLAGGFLVEYDYGITGWS